MLHVCAVQIFIRFLEWIDTFYDVWCLKLLKQMDTPWISDKINKNTNMRKGVATLGEYWEISLAEKYKLFFQNSLDGCIQHNPEFLIYAYLPYWKGLNQFHVMDSMSFLACCLLTLSHAICLCTGLTHICEKQQIEVHPGNTVSEIVLAMRLVWVGFLLL